MSDEIEFYNGGLSYSDKQEVWIPGKLATKTSWSKASGKLMKWGRSICQRIHEARDNGMLREIQKNEECNLYVTFYINQANPAYDIDNLLKVLLDWLKKDSGKYKSLLKDMRSGKNLSSESIEYMRLRKLKKLIPDDEYFRGIRAEREMIEAGEEEGAKIKYVLTKTLIIDKVETVEGNDLVGYWRSPMQLITARQIINGKEVGRYKFIDNNPGQLFLVKQDINYAKLIPPGYDWKGVEKRTVNGCMVFEKIARDEDEMKSFPWLTKW